MIAKFSGVSKFYGKKKIISDMSFEIERGEIVGLLGPNGSGKTTAMKLLSGMIYPDGGNISRACKFRSLIETPRFYNMLSGFDNLLYFASLEKMGDEQVKKAVKILGMESYIKRRVGQYSLGMRQKLGLACALLGDPDLIILDEPINGLDPLAVVETREIFKRIRDGYGAALLISSHILQEMQAVCDRVILIKSGAVIANMPILPAKSLYAFSFLTEGDREMAGQILGESAKTGKNLRELYVSGDKPVYEVISLLAANGVKICEAREKGSDLEEVYCSYFKEGYDD